MEMDCNNNKKSSQHYGKGLGKHPQNKQTSVSAKQKIGLIRRLTRDCKSPRDVSLVTKWLAILGHTNRDEALARDYLLELIHHQLRESSRLSSPFTKLESYRRELHSVLREVGRQQLRRLGLLKRQSTTALRVPKPSRASLITHHGNPPKPLASKEAMKQVWRQKIHQLDDLEAKYRWEEKQLRELEFQSAAAAAAKSKESRKPPQKPPMVLTVAHKELLCGKEGKNEVKTMAKCTDVPASCPLLAERNNQYRQCRRQTILERKERERKERNQRECEREQQRRLRAERQQKEKELLVSNRAYREKEHRERSRTVQERRQHERQLIESRKERQRPRELRPSEQGQRSRPLFERNQSPRQLQTKPLRRSSTSQKSCWLCNGTARAKESLGLRIHLAGWMCDVCQQHVRLDPKVVRSCSLEPQKKLWAENASSNANANANVNNKKLAKGERDRLKMQKLEMEMEMEKTLQKSHMMESHRQRPLERSSDEESSAEGKAAKDEHRPRRRSGKKDGNPKNVKSEEKQRPTDVRESQKRINEINARKVLKSNGGEGQLEGEKRKEVTIRWERKRRESDKIKRKEANDIENREEEHQKRETEELERKELEKQPRKEPEKKEVLNDREIVKKWSGQEWKVKEGAPNRCTDEDTISPESRSATQEDMEEEQLDRRREMQWDLLLKLLESEKLKRRHQSQETVSDRNNLTTKEELERNPSKYDTLEGAQPRKELRLRESEERRRREETELADANGIQARKELEKRASLRLYEEVIKREQEEFERKELEKQKLMMESQIMKACPWQEWPTLGPLKKITAGARASAATGPQTEEEKENRREGGRATQWDTPLKRRQSKEKNLRHQSQEPDNARKEVEEKDGLKRRTWPEQVVREQRGEELRAAEKQKIERQGLRREETKETKRREGTEKKSKEELQLEQPVQDRRPHEEREKLRESKEIQIKRSTDLERVSRKEKTECGNPGNVRLHKEPLRTKMMLAQKKLKNDIQKDEVERKSSEKQLERVRRERQRIIKEEGQKNQIKTKEQPEKRAKEQDRAREPEDEELRLRKERKMTENGGKSCLNLREELTGREREQQPKDDRMRNGNETEGMPREELKRKEGKEKERKEREQPKGIASGDKLDREQREREHAQQEERQKREEDESQHKLRNDMKKREELDARVMEDEFERRHEEDRGTEELDERGSEKLEIRATEGELKNKLMELEQNKSTKEIGIRRRKKNNLKISESVGTDPQDLRERCGGNGNELEGRAEDDELERKQVDSIQQFDEQWKKAEKEELESKDRENVEWRNVAEEVKGRKKIQTKLEDVTRKDCKRLKRASLKEKQSTAGAKEECNEQLPAYAKGETGSTKTALLQKKETNEHETVTGQPHQYVSQTEADNACMEVLCDFRKRFLGRATDCQHPERHSSWTQLQGEVSKLIDDIQGRDQILQELNQNVARSQRVSGRCLATFPVDSDHTKYVNLPHRVPERSAGDCASFQSRPKEWTKNQAHARLEQANDSGKELLLGANELMVCHGRKQRETKRTTRPLPRTHQSISGNGDQAAAWHGSYFETKMKVGSESKPRSSSSIEYFAPRPSILQHERWVRFMETDEGTSVGDTETSTDVPEPVQGMCCPQKEKTCVMEQQQDAEEAEQQSKKTQMVSPPVSYCTRTGRKRFRPELARYQLNRRKGLSRHQERHVLCPILSRKGEANEDPEALCRRLQSDNALMESKIAEARRRTRGKHIAVSMMSGAANVVRLFQLGRRNKEPKPEETRWTEHFGDLPHDFDLPTSKLRKIIHSESQRAVKLPGHIFQTISKALNSRGGQLTGSLLKCIDTMDASLEEHLQRVLNCQFEVRHVPDLLQMAGNLEDQERSTATNSLAETCRSTQKSHQQHWKQLSDHFISLTQASFSDHCDVGDDLVQAAFQAVVRSYTAWSSRRPKNVARD